MATSSALTELRDRKAALLEQIVSLADFRPGSLIGRFRKCGKPYCHCAREGDPGHGPSWSLTRAVGGKTVTKIIDAQVVELTKGQIAEYHRFQQIAHELVETNAKICDALLEPHGETEDDPQRAEKRGSTPRLRRKSKPS